MTASALAIAESNCLFSKASMLSSSFIWVTWSDAQPATPSECSRKRRPIRVDFKFRLLASLPTLALNDFRRKRMLLEPLLNHAKNKPNDVAIVDDRGSTTYG